MWSTRPKIMRLGTQTIKEGEKDQDEAGTVGHTYIPRIQMSEAGGL